MWTMSVGVGDRHVDNVSWDDRYVDNVSWGDRHAGLACNEVKILHYNTWVVISSNWRVTK